MLAPSVRVVKLLRRNRNITGNVKGAQAETFVCQFSSWTWAPVILRGERAGFPGRGASSLWVLEGLLLKFWCSMADSAPADPEPISPSHDTKSENMITEGLLHRWGRSAEDFVETVPSPGGLYVKVVPPPDTNKNTSWFQYPGIWTTYILILLFSWLAIVSAFQCQAGTAWTVVNLVHFAVTYRFFHWKKGTPFAEDQGDYGKLTWWEQVDDGRQLTRNRKFLTVVPVVLYLIASHTTDYKNPTLFLNTIAVCWLVIAKFPNMHKVRIFGINSDYDT